MPGLDNPLVVSTIMLLWGIAVRYAPKLKDWPNRLIVWMNIAIGILAKLVAPEPAHAGFFSALGQSLGALIVPFEALLARAVFEGFVKPTLEHFGVKGFPAKPIK